MWKYREHLSYFGKLRRSIYEILRDSLERRLMKIALIDSFLKFREHNAKYYFVEKSELKPKSKKMEKESDFFNTFLVIFCEDTVSDHLKNYIRFFPENSVVKENMKYLAEFPLYRQFRQNLRHFDSPDFFNLIEQLLDVDYALLIQQDPSVKKKNRYSLTHFHVKIDWPIADAAQGLAKSLRYIQSNLYENGDKEGRILQSKLFEYYGCHHSVGGRRTAGLIAAQLLKQLPFVSTVFLSSSESRVMYRYSERGVSKFFLIQFSDELVQCIAEQKNVIGGFLKSDYLYTVDDVQIGILEAYYGYTPHSRPPDDGKLRKVKAAYNWLRLEHELLHPRFDAPNAMPIRCNWVYSPD